MFSQLCTMEASYIPGLNQTMEMMAHQFYTLFGGTTISGTLKGQFTHLTLGLKTDHRSK